MEISRYLRQHARTIAGKSQLFINSYAKALEVGGVWLLLSMNLIFLANVRNWPLFLGYKIIWGDELISLRSLLLGALGLRHPCPSVKHVYHVQHCCNQFCYLVFSPYHLNLILLVGLKASLPLALCLSSFLSLNDKPNQRSMDIFRVFF